MFVMPVFIKKLRSAAGYAPTPEETRMNTELLAYMTKASETPQQEREDALKRLGKMYDIGGNQ